MLSPTAQEPSHARLPTGAVHEVGLDDLFFSTTDAKGVITSANEVFVRLSRFSQEVLLHAPHNIIRHPAMPGGAFRAMWDTITSGQVFACYVRNLAADGSEYNVFATITPLRDGSYLSVRTRPVCEELLSTALSVYGGARKVEDRALTQGSTRREAAQLGAAHIVRTVKGLGLEDYEAFQNTALPAEVARREELGATWPERPFASGLLGTMLRTVTDLNEDLGAWTKRQDELADLAGSLRAASHRLSHALAPARLTNESVSLLAHEGPQVSRLTELLRLWLQMQGIVSQQVDRLVRDLALMERSVGRMRLRIALAHLHAAVTDSFIVERIDSQDAPGVHSAAELSHGAIGQLTQALEDGIAELARHSTQHAASGGADHPGDCPGPAGPDHSSSAVAHVELQPCGPGPAPAAADPAAVPGHHAGHPQLCPGPGRAQRACGAVPGARRRRVARDPVPARGRGRPGPH